MKWQSILVLAGILLASASVSANVTLDDGLSYTLGAVAGGDNYLGSTINDFVLLDSIIANDPGTHLNLTAGGSIVYYLRAYNNSTVTMTSGSAIGTPEGYALSAYDNSTITVNGGTIGGSLRPNDNSTVTITGGTIGLHLRVQGNSTVTMSGGIIEDDLAIRDNSTVTMSGGSVENGLLLFQNGLLYLVGSNFSVDGKPVSNGDILSSYGTLRTQVGTNNDYYTGYITGTLNDGSTLANVFDIYKTGYNTIKWEGTADIVIVIIPTPSAIILGSIGVGFVTWLRRRKML